jgi:hypothetical protein
VRFGRLAWGIIAGTVGTIVAFAVQAVETRVIGTTTGKLFWVAFVGAGGGVLWLVDRLGLLASPYSDETLELRRLERANTLRRPDQ